LAWKEGVLQILDESKLRDVARYDTRDDAKRPII
jgi:hypothetical protein